MSIHSEILDIVAFVLHGLCVDEAKTTQPQKTAKHDSS